MAILKIKQADGTWDIVKPVTDEVKYIPQILTDEQKAQARENIGLTDTYTHAITNKGSAFSSGLYKITTNSEGHVTNATAVTKSDITGLGIPDSNTKVTQAAAITTAGNYPVLLGYSTATTAVTNTVNKASSFTYNPSTGVLTATKVEATMDDGDLF